MLLGDAAAWQKGSALNSLFPWEVLFFRLVLVLGRKSDAPVPVPREQEESCGCCGF